MPVNGELPHLMVDQIRRNPLFAVARELAEAARDYDFLATREFRYLFAYLLDQADGRDRRDTMVQPAGSVRPIPRLRVLIDDCFGQYGDLQWFKINKTTNASRMRLAGLFPRMAASLARVNPNDFAEIVEALLATNPDLAIDKVLKSRKGKIRNVGVELFSRIVHVLRRDLFFLIPPMWHRESGVGKYVRSDLRRYCRFSRGLRQICDTLDFDKELRGQIFDRVVHQDVIPDDVQTVLHQIAERVIGWGKPLCPNDGQRAEDIASAAHTNLVEATSAAIRSRRGDEDLRAKLRIAYGDKCAISGPCLSDLLEIAFVLPFTSEQVRAERNVILLRSDLHTLWDLNLIAVNPATMELHIAQHLAGTYLEEFVGKTLLPREDGSRLSKSALSKRWNAFCDAHVQDEALTEPVEETVATTNEATADESMTDAPAVEIEVVADRVDALRTSLPRPMRTGQVSRHEAG